ncbi:uncharacterized protein L201_004186 [Kwoniella dendrophila CBS 6074]|uniref:Raptor N-terminal CASPase-like domain-containing protein n=1 Tax=Kwoniella dendrophila CBS 6074 TaxID=1295534 RepID=A0AAX4JXL3_9TREE
MSNNDQTRHQQHCQSNTTDNHSDDHRVMVNQSMKSEKSINSSGWITANPSSFASSKMRGGGLSDTLSISKIPKQPLAWASIRHQVKEENSKDPDEVMKIVNKDQSSGDCTQAIFITCLHLSHEMSLRDVGQYAWMIPNVKDPMGSMMKIMKQYSQRVRSLSKHNVLDCRSAPDPSKVVIQHHLQRARQQAGPDNYITVFYNGHGIQEPPTEQGELWCYDRSFDECLQSGGGPSEYIPIMLFDVLAWSGSLSCYIWDVSYSGRFIKAALMEAKEIDNQFTIAAQTNPKILEVHKPNYYEKQIHFTSCGSQEKLPKINGLPDDLFTSCLINPLKIALLWHNLQIIPLSHTSTTITSGLHKRNNNDNNHGPKSQEYMDLLWENMSSSLKERLKTELFSIIHTIAWQTMTSNNKSNNDHKNTYKGDNDDDGNENGNDYLKLFGKPTNTNNQDISLISNLSTGFILSKRIFNLYGIHPQSIPSINDSVINHNLWITWDLILDNFFEQLPKYFDQSDQSNRSNQSDFEWEKKLNLVSFMKDQLESISSSLSSSSSTFISSTTATGNIMGNPNTILNRLPIICFGINIKEFRLKSIQALNSLLKSLGLKTLKFATKGGILDVSINLLHLGLDIDKQEDSNTTMKTRNNLISIWSSLVRYDLAVLSLLQRNLAQENDKNTIQTNPIKDLSGLPHIQIFLNSLEENLVKGISISDCQDQTDLNDVEEDEDEVVVLERLNLIIQNSVVLSTIANFLTVHHGTINMDHIKVSRFVLKTLSMSGIMLNSSHELVKQWGALLNAQVLALNSTNSEFSKDGNPKEGDGFEMIANLKENLLGMVKSSTVETRASAVYALIRWIPVHDKTSLLNTKTEGKGTGNMEGIQSSLEIVEQLVRLSSGEGSPLARRELSRIFIIFVEILGEYTDLALWIWILQHSIKNLPNKRKEVEGLIAEIGRKIGIQQKQLDIIKVLQRVVDAIIVFAQDADHEIVKIVKQPLIDLFISITPSEKEHDIKPSSIFNLAHGTDATGSAESLWTEELLDVMMNLKEHLLEKWGQGANRKDSKGIYRGKSLRYNNELFERSRSVLQSYLMAFNEERIVRSHTGDPSQRTSITRHRVLEDSLVVAEQQVGLPWKWEMKDITSPDPWTSMTFHSFHSTVMSCNGSHDLLLWDWSTSRKTGNVHLDLPKNEMISSARFLNELHEQTVILAEITNGDIHILSGPQDPMKIKPISNFRALDISSGSNMISEDIRNHKKLITTWYRSSGLLCVGGYSNKINVWDCPAERCVQVLKTESNSPITTLKTEPVSGNLIFSGLSNGMIQLYDLRQSNKRSLISWQGDLSITEESKIRESLQTSNSRPKSVLKIGVVLGESKYISSACSNGLMNTFDLRQLSKPINSIISHENGISSASFQPHSGLMSTISKNTTTNQSIPNANFSLYRTTQGEITLVTSDHIQFPQGQFDHTTINERFKPYTIIHPLRPFLSLGFGKKWFLRGCGIGKGDNTDSGSYTFLKSQAKYVS